MTLPGSAVVPRACHGSAVAFLIVIVGGRMILGNAMFVGSVWHPLGHLVPAGAAPPRYMSSAGVAAEVDHAMVCETVGEDREPPWGHRS